MPFLRTLFESLLDRFYLHGELVDDTFLKELLVDYKAEITRWVFARDMTEYYDRVEEHNKRSNQKITVILDIGLNSRLIQTLNRKEHEYFETPIWEQQVANLGPHYVAGFVISYGSKKYNADYIHTGQESFLRFQLPDGSTKDFNFGVGDRLDTNPNINESKPSP